MTSESRRRWESAMWWQALPISAHTTLHIQVVGFAKASNNVTVEGLAADEAKVILSTVGEKTQ